jgi:peptidoglycan/xylan/chitin deacetylase (PgdA/CDA1 family)
MFIRSLLSRVSGKYRRTVSIRFSRRKVKIRTSIPIISFSFDDAPKSAFITGANILKANSARGTFFVSLGLLNSESPSGKIASKEDLRRAMSDGFELGCHTFDHQDPWKTPAGEFYKSVLKNRQTLVTILPNATFASFAYPINEPRPEIKRRMGEHFRCCRGGGQTFNSGTADLNLLKGYFLDHRNRNDIDSVKREIDLNVIRRGWLIFGTHDVCETPSAYGCTDKNFETVVKYAVNSGSIILPVTKACELIQGPFTERTF